VAVVDDDDKTMMETSSSKSTLGVVEDHHGSVDVDSTKMARKRSYTRRKHIILDPSSSLSKDAASAFVAPIPPPIINDQPQQTGDDDDQAMASSTLLDAEQHRDAGAVVVESTTTSTIMIKQRSYTRRKHTLPVTSTATTKDDETAVAPTPPTIINDEQPQSVVVPLVTPPQSLDFTIAATQPSTIQDDASNTTVAEAATTTTVKRSYTRRKKHIMPVPSTTTSTTKDETASAPLPPINKQQEKSSDDDDDVMATLVNQRQSNDSATASKPSPVDDKGVIPAAAAAATTKTMISKKSYTRRKNREMARSPLNNNNAMASSAVVASPTTLISLFEHQRAANEKVEQLSSRHGPSTTAPEEPTFSSNGNDVTPPLDHSHAAANDDVAAVRRLHHPTVKWRANYHVSVVTQDRIKAFARRDNHDAVQILQYFTSLDPYQCNAANVVCAVTLAAKTLSSTIGCDENDSSRSKASLRTHLATVLAIVDELIDTEQKQNGHILSARQLANLAWGLAKFYDYDATLQPLNRWDQVSCDGNVVESWNIGSSSIHHRSEDGARNGADDDALAVTFSTIVDSIAIALKEAIRANPDAVKTQELCMACWAYGVLRRRRRPTGWQTEPMVGTLMDAGQAATIAKEKRNDDIIDFYGFDEDDDDVDECAAANQSSVLAPVEILLDEIALAFCHGPERIQNLQWKELANVAWAYATIGRSGADTPLTFLHRLSKEATGRITNDAVHGTVQSRDLAQIIWSLGILQSDNYRLSDGFNLFVDAVAERIVLMKGIQDISQWSCADIVQTALSLAHARLDEQGLLLRLYKEATARIVTNHSTGAGAMQVERKSFFDWELSVLLWIQARLYLTEQLTEEYAAFTISALKVFSDLIDEGRTLASAGIGSQERANIAWSIAVLNCWQHASIQNVLGRVFAEACAECQEQNCIQLDHAHQLWQTWKILEPHCPQCFADVPAWFRAYLDHQWKVEKARPKKSSARHKALSKTLSLLGVAHVNEHDEDIDVAIVLKPLASWTHETVRSEMPMGVKVAVEFDGPMHFTRQRRRDNGPPRTLGHTVLKYRLLKQSGWTVVRVPYYEFDRIPFWASMERQRYVQRLLKTHGSLRFSHVDVSEYKSHVPNRSSRYD
jgi:hypothetical protein